VINVQQKCEWGKKFCKELDYLCRISKNLDAEMLIFFSDNPIDIINDCIERRNVKHIILGDSEIKASILKEQLYIKSKGIEIHICKYQ